MGEYILDIVQNSVESGASMITLDFLESEESVKICIGDNGCGMDEKTLEQVTDPFYTDGQKHAHRKVGLGIPFLKQAVESVEGEFDLSSDPEIGTSLMFSFKLGHIDCPPLGDLAGIFRSIMLFDGHYNLLIYRTRGDSSYRISRDELAESLGDLYDAQSLLLMKQYFDSQEEELM